MQLPLALWVLELVHFGGEVTGVARVIVEGGLSIAEPTAPLSTTCQTCFHSSQHLEHPEPQASSAFWCSTPAPGPLWVVC
ncbi:hypothetical protein EDB81DRAFT_798880 [Dactylonectria macrodidyma]|uniref:Secreted protein n=1 Tax=Dactylonectria macrodidyma TaxID=307937 RepID=A0A9P9EP91_9HYPO|nr:hypothetical protein EDB81DRAFT_798880 [Dactylonectria macrodidyma]